MIITSQRQELFSAAFNYCSIVSLGLHLTLNHVETKLVYFNPSSCTILGFAVHSAHLQDSFQVLHVVRQAVA